MILVVFGHGLRASEVVAIKAGNLRDGYLTADRLKGSLKTVQPLIAHPDPLLDEKKALFDFTRGMTRNQRLFPVTRMQFWRIVSRHTKAAGIAEHLDHPHAPKNTIAMQCIKKAGIVNTRQWLGHMSIASTGQYLRVTDGQAATAVSKALGARRV
jgi:site-specific recombinase XerD